MDLAELKTQWLREEEQSFHGWDFSHIDGRWDEDPLSWDYRETVLRHLRATSFLLDMGTGGGEFLLSLNHPYWLTSVTEAYPPNVELCKQKLAPLGIRVERVFEDDMLPFDDASFDIVINRHESFNVPEVRRVLKSGGVFITQQVGGKNSNDLSRRLIAGFEPRFPNHSMENNLSAIKSAGFGIIDSREEFPKMRFLDIGALVYYAKIIEWEFPDFSVETAFDRLCECQKEIEERGSVQSTAHRFMIVARIP